MAITQNLKLRHMTGADVSRHIYIGMILEVGLSRRHLGLG